VFNCVNLWLPFFSFHPTAEFRTLQAILCPSVAPSISANSKILRPVWRLCASRALALVPSISVTGIVSRINSRSLAKFADHHSVGLSLPSFRGKCMIISKL
jgi:hypothetical protein